MRLTNNLGSIALLTATLAVTPQAFCAPSLSPSFGDKVGTQQAVAAQNPAMTTTPTANPLDVIAWMKGGTWVAEVKDKDGNITTRIETRIRGSENGRLIKFTTTFISHNKPDLHYEGVYLYNPQSKQIEFYYTDPEGNFTRGRAVFADGKLTQDFDIIHMSDGHMSDGHMNDGHMNAQVETLRSYVVRDGENAYNWNVMSNKSGEWKELLHLRYVREVPADGGR